MKLIFVVYIPKAEEELKVEGRGESSAKLNRGVRERRLAEHTRWQKLILAIFFSSASDASFDQSLHLSSLILCRLAHRHHGQFAISTSGCRSSRWLSC
jgi:hypothetical protein